MMVFNTSINGKAFILRDFYISMYGIIIYIITVTSNVWKAISVMPFSTFTDDNMVFISVKALTMLFLKNLIAWYATLPPNSHSTLLNISCKDIKNDQVGVWATWNWKMMLLMQYLVTDGNQDYGVLMPAVYGSYHYMLNHASYSLTGHGLDMAS